MGLIVIDSDFMVMNGDWPSGKLSYNNGRSPCYWWGNELHGHWVCPRSWRYWSRHHLDDLGRNSLFRNPPTGDNGGILKTFFWGGGGGGEVSFLGKGFFHLKTWNRVLFGLISQQFSILPKCNSNCDADCPNNWCIYWHSLHPIAKNTT